MRKQRENPLSRYHLKSHIKLIDHVFIDIFAFETNDVFDDPILLMHST